MKTSMILQLGLALGIAGMAEGYHLLNTPRVLGRVLLAQGKTLIPGSPLRVGDDLKTAPGETLALSLTPGIAAWISERGELKIEELRVVKNGETIQERFAQVRLERGTAIFSVASAADGQVELRVSISSITVISQPGSVFTLSVSENGAGVRLLCTAGALFWRDRARATSGWVLSGHFQDCGGAVPSFPSAISTDGKAQLATLALFDSVRALNQLSDQLNSQLTPRTVKSADHKP